MKTLDDLMGDYQLYSYAMKAYGLEDFTYAKGFMKKVFASDLSDSNSFANKLTDPRYKTIAAACNFGAGAKPTAQTAATETAMFGMAATKTTDATLGLYQQSFATEESLAATETSYYDYNIGKVITAQFNFAADGTIKPTTADGDKAYYEANIGAVTTVSGLTSDAKLFDYVRSAYGIAPYVTDLQFAAAVADPKTAAKYGLTAALSHFNFQENGKVEDGEPVQTADQIADTSSKYVAQYSSGAQTLGQKATVMDVYNDTVPTWTPLKTSPFCGIRDSLRLCDLHGADDAWTAGVLGFGRTLSAVERGR